jgi:hypothetical protein
MKWLLRKRVKLPAASNFLHNSFPLFLLSSLIEIIIFKKSEWPNGGNFNRITLTISFHILLPAISSRIYLQFFPALIF